MAAGMQDDDDEITGINVTPLVDIMLVLLIIFMVTANYIVNQSIDIKLPKAETGETKAQTLNLAFAINADSKLFLDGKEIEYSQVEQKIQEFKTKSTEEQKSLQALISADQKTPHGEVIKIIDIVRKNGITDFAINVEVPAEEAK